MNLNFIFENINICRFEVDQTTLFCIMKKSIFLQNTPYAITYISWIESRYVNQQRHIIEQIN